MHSLVILLVAAASVAFIHAVLPDHWMPIALIARAERWSLGRTGRVSLWTSVGHVVGSLAIGAILIVVGASVHAFTQFEGPIVGVVLILTGVGFLIWSLRKGAGHSHGHDHGHHHHLPPGIAGEMHLEHDHHDHDHDHDHGHDHDHHQGHGPAPAVQGRGHGSRSASVLIPLGIAASPDLTILPVMVAALPLGALAIAEVVIVYTLMTMVSIVLLSVAATAGGYQVHLPWLEHNAEILTSGVLMALGVVAVLAF